MKNSRIIPILIFTLASLFMSAQDLMIIEIIGEAYGQSMIDDKTQYKKLVYGPINNIKKIVVKEKASVRLTNEDRHVAVLDKEGEYPIDKIVFTPSKDVSMFDKFCDYFHSFFISHESTESKANYKNNIYAISRGANNAPDVNFPLEGVLPFGRLDPMPFYWTNDCQDCTYQLEIFDYTTRKSIYQYETIEKQHQLNSNQLYLEKGKKYYYTVGIKGESKASEPVIFEMSSKADFEKIISSLRTEVNGAAQGISNIGEAIYIMSSLEESGLVNYAILYGFHLKEKYPNDATIIDLTDRIWYDQLLNR